MPMALHALTVTNAVTPPETIKWTDKITAISGAVTAAFTIVLAVGIVIAARQFALSRRFSRLQETQHLIDLINASKLSRINNRVERFDGIPTYLETSRQKANRLYARLHRLKGRKYFSKAWKKLDSAIQDVADVTDRIEIYIRKGNADEGTIAEHAGYCILSTYYILQDVLALRTLEDDLSYEGFRDLSRRIQDYGKLYQLESELRDELVWAVLPPFKYADGMVSKSYLPWWAVWRKFRLQWATKRRQRKTQSRSKIQ